MNPSTNESELFSGLSALIHNNVLIPVCTYLNKRETVGPVTVEELASLLLLPSSSPAPSGRLLSNAPPSLSNVPTDSKKRTTRAKTALDDKEQCVYVYYRGVQEGKRCTKKVTAGSNYCTSHKSTKVAKQSTGGTVDLPGGFPPVKTNKGNISVDNIGPGLYREATHNLLLKTGERANEYIACGVINNDDIKNPLPLTDKEIEYCKSIGVAYVDPKLPAKGSPLPVVGGSPLPRVGGSPLPRVGLTPIPLGGASSDVGNYDDPVDDLEGEDEM